MTAPRGRWSFNLRTILVVAFLLTAAFFVHGVWSGIGVPYPDPTPTQMDYQRYHRAISDLLVDGAILAWLLAAIISVAKTVGRRFARYSG